jgi:tetratricopeptide (TPR) repeat protein
LNQKPQACLRFYIVSLLLWPVSSLSALAATEPDQSEATTHELLTKAYEQICKSNFSKAVPTLCQVVRADRNSPSARRYLAFVLLHEGRGKAALAQLDALNRLQRSCTFDILLRGIASDMIGEHERALECFRETMAREPQSDYYRMKTIDELLVLLQYDEAHKMATEGYNNAKDPKATAMYAQKIKKTLAIMRLTEHAAPAAASPAFTAPTSR